MEEEEKLDIILNRFKEFHKDGNHPDMSEIHQTLYEHMTLYQFKVRVQKLRDDGYVLEIPNHTGPNPTSWAYQITPNGRIF